MGKGFCRLSSAPVNVSSRGEVQGPEQGSWGIRPHPLGHCVLVSQRIELSPREILAATLTVLVLGHTRSCWVLQHHIPTVLFPRQPKQVALRACFQAPVLACITAGAGAEEWSISNFKGQITTSCLKTASDRGYKLENKRFCGLKSYRQDKSFKLHKILVKHITLLFRSLPAFFILR